MKKFGWILLAVLLVAVLASCTLFDTFFPSAQMPVDDRASMLVVEAGTRDGDATTNLVNLNATGWAPWVEDESGNIVPFMAFDAESRLDSLFWAENLRPGTYTLRGFLHIYADYSLLPDGIIMSYEPFAGRQWHKTQRFALDQPVVIKLGEAEIKSFGRYFVQSAWVEGALGTSDTRWMVNPASVKIVGDPADKKALRVMKNWATKTWLAWNTRNTEPAADK